MSAGGQRGIDVSGVGGLRVQNASDFVTGERLQLVYQTFASTTGANAYRNETPNSYGSYIDFLQGIRPFVDLSCTTCAGSPWIQNPQGVARFSRSFRT
jgi:hypothetical protein